ncbi:hypothetical protein ACPEEZ_14930 [Frigoribacterium sp. 2-23]|uniref:hypothetical protein n=1 Tax=Frigoribacterium sp. 2-23 TaxID=3415006 RepID=UPI003C6F98B6
MTPEIELDAVGGDAADVALVALADELGALAAAVPGVVRVQARPGLGALIRGALKPGRPVPVVGIAVAELETRVTLDLAVTDGAAGPRVARDVAQQLLARLDLEALPPASVDVRIVGVVTSAS